jgi:DNA-binding transcriptional MerR regulator
MAPPLQSIPAKRYFTISEVGDLCDVKPHVLRYWEQEFTQLRPMKRRGNRRYYQRHEVLMIRRIRELLYDQGFTISGARNKLQETSAVAAVVQADGAGGASVAGAEPIPAPITIRQQPAVFDQVGEDSHALTLVQRELHAIRNLLALP